MRNTYLNAVKWKWRSLKILSKIQGERTNNLLMFHRQEKYVKRAEKIAKFKVNLLQQENELGLFKHPSGCSLQFVIMCNILLGGDEWHKKYCNPYAESAPENTSFEIQSLMSKINSRMRNV